MKKKLKLTAVFCVLAIFWNVFMIPGQASTKEPELSEAPKFDVSELFQGLEELKEKAKEAEGEVPEILCEQTDLREESIKYFLREDGATVAAIYDEPVHYKRYGKLVDIDNTLLEAKNESGEKVYRNKANSLIAELPAELDSTSPVTVKRVDSNHALSWTFSGEKIVSGKRAVAESAAIR